ncbi:L-threonylcarbamoyladenylate synthase [Actinocorallia sp. A-T 12471]|uniref:L-threonylcarbamoyladenylate synthase n=1 Tax=Actinocorallia sp. A-T 12471 TaxID=3089813 RepID=UPI0029CB01B4|nr:L-threonylcarbamoyladenylate synthase [Actinocorallia sp. A-T 12471]MDX6743742.1 L-threonylcarbamoyladenylate synthase [Actinocorallia sp. A-T 12471]
MSRHYDCSDPLERARGIADAASCLRRGEVVVMPTDTVYGIASDAFTPAAVRLLLETKGRGRDMPPPVLVGSVRAATALIDDLGPYGQDVIDEFWPGALTVVCHANPSLAWDLGDTKGTVAVRMPLHDLALELLRETGPLAVSSANLSGHPAARTVEEAEAMLGDKVSVYLNDGPSGGGQASSIVDLTGTLPKLLRRGAISESRLRSVCGVLLRDELLGDDDDELTDDALAVQEAAAAEALKKEFGAPGDAQTDADKPADDKPEDDKPADAVDFVKDSGDEKADAVDFVKGAEDKDAEESPAKETPAKDV